MPEPEQAGAPRRRHRRVIRPATGGAAGPEPRTSTPAPDIEAVAAKEREHDRWLKEQRPPHWG